MFKLGLVQSVMNVYIIALLGLGLATATPTHAQAVLGGSEDAPSFESGAADAAVSESIAPPQPPDDEGPWRLGIALGYGQRSNPLALSDDITILVDLDFGWFGKRWFFDNGDLGFTLRDDSLFTVNLIGRLNSDRVFFSKTDSRLVVVNLTGEPGGPTASEVTTVPDRDFALELGLELLSDGNWGYLQAAAHRDVSSVHDGYELYLNYGRGFRDQRWYFEPSLGLSYKSERLNDYYWGVRESEASLAFPAYRAGAGLNKHIRLFTSYQINPRWAFIVVAEYERLSSESASSPIVEDRDVRGIFSGFAYRF